MARPRITITMQGQHVAEWLDSHVMAPGSNTATQVGPLTSSSAYERRASWEVPVPDDPQSPVKTLSHALRQFTELVPDSDQLLNAKGRLVVDLTWS